MGARIFMAIVLGTAFLISFSKAGALAGEGVFEIIKATENVAWRLNKKTGEISACRFTGDTMTCASSDTAVVRPKTSFDELKKEQKRERAEMQNEEMAMLERLLAYFKKLARSFKELERDLKSKDYKAEPEPEKIN